jgi:hypothetical protein
MLTQQDIERRGAPKLPVVILTGEVIDEKVARNLLLLSIYLDIETDISDLGENILSFNDGVPHLNVQTKDAEAFVSLGIRAVFDAHGWTYERGDF